MAVKFQVELLLIALALAANSVAGAGQAEVAQPSVDVKRSSHDELEDYMLLDAFNMGLCGRIVPRGWQREQSAFGCNEFVNNSNSNKNQVAPRIYGGEWALEGEFPSFVQINSTLGERDCGAALIHNDLVVTAAHCVAEVSEALGMSLIAGSDWLDGRGGQLREAERWCWPTRYEIDVQNLAHYDLALIKLAKPVQYVSGKVWPACVRLDALHSDSAVCALSGKGYNSTDGSSSDVHLKTLPIARTCSSDEWREQSCYQSTKEFGTSRRGDSGSPVYCYDRCSEHLLSDQIQAFAVAAVSWGPEFVLDGKADSHVADFRKLRSHFKSLVREVRREGKGSSKVICRNSHALKPPTSSRA